MAELNWADWVLIFVIAFSTLMSLSRGFVKEALSLVTWVAAFVVARSFHPYVQSLLADSVDQPFLTVAAFALLFFVMLILGAVFSFTISALIKMTGLSPLDRMLGMVFGLSRGLILCVVAIAILRLTPVVESEWWKGSKVIDQLIVLETWSRQMFERKLSEV